MVDGNHEEGGKIGKNGDEKEGVEGRVHMQGDHEGHHGVSVQVRGGEEDPKSIGCSGGHSSAGEQGKSYTCEHQGVQAGEHHHGGHEEGGEIGQEHSYQK